MKKITPFLVCLILSFTSSLPLSQAARKKALTPQVKKILAMTEFAQPLRGNHPEFFIRGTLTSVTSLGKQKYQLGILPIEVLSNRQHYVSLEKYQKGLQLQVRIHPKAKKRLQPGNMIELNQYYIVHKEGKGAAVLVSLEFKQDFKAYPASSAAYVKKTNLPALQLINALAGLSYSSSTPQNQDSVLLQAIQTLKKHKNPQVRKNALKVKL